MDGKIVEMKKPQIGKSVSDKREKFVELAQKRTVKAIKAIRSIGKLGNRSAYVYTDTDVNRIVKAINDEIEALKARMKNSKGTDTIKFEL